MTKIKKSRKNLLDEMPSVLDRQLVDSTGDAFGHQQYAEALRHLIEAESNEPPFSIGLLGSWGTGKSSIKEIYLDGLSKDKSGQRGQRRSDKVHAITFNAWRYGGEDDLKRALLRDAFKQLGGDEEELRQELFEQVNKVTNKTKSFREWFGEAAGQILATAAVFALLLAICLVLAGIFVWMAGLSDQLTIGFFGVATVVAAVFLGKYVVDLKIRSPALFRQQNSISFPSTSAEEYERLLVEQIDKFRKGEGKSCERLVIFVDDLDRLSASEMVAGLDAIRTFLELPVNTSENRFGVVFVISCDENRIAEALHRGRGRVGTADLPATVFSLSDARRYLDRLFQFRLEIPLFPKQDMRQFAAERLKETGNIVNRIEANEATIENIVDRLIHVDVQSPRNAIQLINAFVQTWWIAERREKQGIGSNEPGALSEGAVTKHPLSLAALCVLRVDFPDFYDCVQIRPEFIREFSRIVFGTDKPENRPIIAQDMLKKFLIVGKDGALSSDVRIEHRKLRQYMSSLQDLRWPKRLQPLLLLSEDPITREYGDSAAAVFDALISGDVQGVLEAFGHDLDTKPLSASDAALLGSLTDTLSQETEARRIGAARVLAALVNRIPEDRKRQLLTPLIRQMVALKPVRMNVQPSAALQIIDGASPDDRREVAERFVDDLLHGGQIEWQLPDGGSPNLDELTLVVRDAVAMVLEVKSVNGLPPNAQTQLVEWLLKREIRVDDKSQSLPFSELEEWVAQYGDDLVDDLGSAYSDQAITAIGTKPTSLRNTHDTVSRIESVQNRLAASGQNERKELWAQLNNLVVVASEIGVEAAWRTAARHSSLADEQQSRAFLVAMSERITSDLGSADNGNLNRKEGAQRFNDLLTEWQRNLDDDTTKKLEPLITTWAVTDSCERYAIRALDVFKSVAKDAWDQAIETTFETELDELPLGYVKYLGENVDLVSEDNRSALVSSMDEIINSSLPDENATKTYKKIISSIPGTSWNKTPLAAHLQLLLSRVNEMHGQAQYLERLFPCAIRLFSFAATGTVATNLVSLFQNAAGAPDAYVALHRAIAKKWPKPDDQIGDYKPDNIVSRACQFVNEHPSHDGVESIFTSVVDLMSRRIATAAINPQIGAILPTVWRAAPDNLANQTSSVSHLFEPSIVVDILSGEQGEDSSDEMLSKVLSSVADSHGHDHHFNTAKEILTKSPIDVFGKPDGALSFWYTALGRDADQVASDLIQDVSLTDDQLRRVVEQTEDFLWADTSNGLLSVILTNNQAPKTRATLVTRLNSIASSCQTANQKSDLANVLIESLTSLSGEELLEVSNAISQLGGQGALFRRRTVIDQLDRDQFDTVKKVFTTLRKSSSGDA